jgi:NADH dehydrogenase
VILVAGGTGRLGSDVVGRLARRGFPVRIFARHPERATGFDGLSVDTVEGDVRDRAGVAAAMDGVTTVVSAVQGFAGTGDVSPASVDRDGNINLIDAAAARGAAVVLMSIVGASADSPMELFRMKHIAEEHLRASSIPWTIVRATAYLEMWLDLLEQTAGRRGRPIVFGRGDNPINFVSVGEVAAVVERVVVDETARGEVVEIGGADNVTFNQLAAVVQDTAGRTARPRHVPRLVLGLMATALRPVKPELARQARAALVMDQADMVFGRGTPAGTPA